MARGNDWMASAACVVDRPDLPWTGEWFDWTLAHLSAMARTCHGCPVRADCAAFADRVRPTSGFWAGRHRDPYAPPVSQFSDRPARTAAELGGAA